MPKRLAINCATCGHVVEADRMIDTVTGGRYPKIDRESLLLHVECDLLPIGIALTYAATESMQRKTYAAGRLNRDGLTLHPASKDGNV